MKSPHSISKVFFLGVGIVVFLGVAAYGYLEYSRSAAKPVDDFLAAHWAFPLDPQGPPPAGFGAEEASLGASACRACHVQQYADWSGSRHRQTMNAGIRWQFHVFGQAASNRCMDCHAPLAEQKAVVAQEMAWSQVPDSAPPAYIPVDLHLEGLTCAACHVRAHRRLGPEHRHDLTGGEEGLPHGGFQPRSEFSDSRFCAACHQFPEDGPRLNGKLRQDTYNEWMRSEFPVRGVGCQECHMPERRHIWRGISDPDMVREALWIQLTATESGPEPQVLRLEIGNSGAGHHFPTYMVPRVDVRVVLMDPTGRPTEQILHHVLQWRASVDLSHEYFDNRLAAGGSVVLEASLPDPQEPGWRLELQVDVAPKEHYERTYDDMLRQADRMDRQTLKLLRQAIAEAAASRFRAFDAQVSLDRPIILLLGSKSPAL